MILRSNRFTRWLADEILVKLNALAARRAPDTVIGAPIDPASPLPYLVRWYVIPRNPIFNIYYHKFYRSDDDRALHDHPWWSVSLMLSKSVEELHHTGAVTSEGIPVIGERSIYHGDIVFRSGAFAHRIVLGSAGYVPICTLFVTGPRFRQWGFHCDKGLRWVHWKTFCSPKDSGQVGRGCD